MSRSPTLSNRPEGKAPMTPKSPTRPRDGRQLRREGQRWTRWLHVYSSMIALLVVLFFSFTGLTANHPEWTFGLDDVTETSSGDLPDTFIAADGSVDFLVVSEYLRVEHDVDGDVVDYGVTDIDGYISYRGPGYSADVFFDVESGSYELNVEEQGLVAVLNDLHKGRNTNSSWNWLIDISAIFLIAISVTGLVLQLFLSRRRKTALTVAAVGGLATLALLLIAVN